MCLAHLWVCRRYVNGICAPVCAGSCTRGRQKRTRVVLPYSLCCSFQAGSLTESGAILVASQPPRPSVSEPTRALESQGYVQSLE